MFLISLTFFQVNAALTNSFLLVLELPELDLDLDDQKLSEDTERGGGAKFCEYGSFICWKGLFKLSLSYVKCNF